MRSAQRSVLLGELAVVPGMAALTGHRFTTEFSFDRCWCTHHQGPGRHIFGDDSSGSHQGAWSHADAIENDGADADQAAIAEGRAVDHCPVADGHIAANQHWLTWIAMEHGAILNIAAFADADAGEVPAGHRGGPETGTCIELNIPNHHSAWCHPGSVAEVRLRPGGRAHGTGVVRVIIFGFALRGMGR